MVWTTFISGLTTWLSVVAVLISLPEPSTAVEFNDTCDESSSLCNTTQDLECAVVTNQTKICKCKEKTYYNGGTCANNIDNLQVKDPGASTVNQTQLLVTWTLPTHSSSIDRIEVSTTPVTQTVTVNNPLATQATLTGLTAGTPYTITITSIETTSRVAEQSTSVTTSGTTGTTVGFDVVCDGSSLVCDTTKDLDCATISSQRWCKCKTANTYHHSGTCVNHPIENLRVIIQTVTTVSQTQLLVTWTLPTHSSSIDRIEVSTTPVTQTVTVNNPLNTNQAALTGLTAGTPYTIKITSIDTTSRATAQSTIVTTSGTTVNNQLTTQATFKGLTGGTQYTITIKSIDTTSKVSAQSTSVTTSETTGTSVGFDNACDGSSLVCDTAKDLDCVTTATQNKQCKCKTVNTYHYSGTCIDHPIENLRVTSPGASTVSQTQLLVTWTLPTHSSSIDRIEVSTTPVTQTVTVNNPLNTNQAALTGLMAGTPYTIKITSLDTTSRVTAQSTSVTITGTTGTTVGFDAVCDGSSLVCDTRKDLDCVTTATQNKQCKCKTVNTYHYSGTCVGHPIENLRVTNPRVTTVSQTQLSVTWNLPTHSSSIDRIEVSTSPVTQTVTVTNPSTRQATLNGLAAGTTYTITVTSIDTTSRATTQSTFVKTSGTTGTTVGFDAVCDGSSLVCDTMKDLDCVNTATQKQCKCKTVNTYYYGDTCVGHPIENLRVTNPIVITVSQTQLSVTWNLPTHSSSIDRIEVSTFPGTQTVTVNNPLTTQATLTGLTAGTTYTITIKCIDTTSRVTAQSTTVITSGTAEPAVPGEIQNVTPDGTGKQVTLSWIASAGVITSYRVVFDGGNGDTRIQTTSTSFITMTLLTPGRRYNITITAISGSMTSDPRYGNTRTTVTTPSAPMNLNCDTIMDTNVTLSWTPPADPNGDIMYYLINVISGPGYPRTVNTTTPVLTKEIDQLTEDSYYSFTVSARNDKYTGPQSMSATCKTKPGLPSKPQNLLITAVLSRDFNVSWMKPNSTKGSLIGYRIAVNNGTTCSQEILYQCSNCTQKPNLTNTCPGDEISMPTTDTSLQNDSFIQKVVGLYPYTTYRVSVNAITGAGDGYKETAVVETKQEAPQDVTQVSADVLNSTAIKLTWRIPDPRPGITTYNIDLYDVINGKETIHKSVSVSGFYERSTILTNLEEYWQYIIYIKASTSIGTSAVKTATPDKTLPAAPGKVTDFKVSKPDGDYKTAIVTWSIPSLRDRNSLITSYEFIHNATGNQESKILSQPTNNEDPFTESITVQPENYYYIEVFAISHENKSGVKSSELYYAPPGPPPNLESTGEKVILKDKNTPATQTTATLIINRNQLTAEGNGKIHSNGIIMCPEKVQVNVATQRQYKDYESFTSWKKAKNDGFKQCYKPTNSSWLQSSKSVTVRKRSTNEHISYTIGDDQTCDKKSENNYCNGPLNPGTSYKAYTFVCTNGGCTESQPIIIITAQTPPSIPFAIIGGVIGALVVIIIVLVVVIIVLKKRRARKGNTHKEFDELKDYVDETETIQKERPFQLQNCAARVADLHKDANLKFAAEYEDIKALSPKHTTDAAEMDQNRLKNRYVNILPFDHSRVKLLPIDDDESTDFINANYLPGYNSPREYIGTQGPIPGTIDDFWRMVWEQNVGIIVMLTLVKEEGRIKCEEYWPMERNDPKQYGELVVETTSYSTVNFYDFRIFKIKLGDKVRTVKHFHFLNWKDFSANVQNDVMIDFIQNVRSHVQPPDKEGPMIVHCSAGVGRTGTYICLDHLMQLINEHDLNTTIDIFVMVLKLRENRSFMVQTEQQYVFIHDCVKDIIEKKKLALQDQGGEDLYMNQDENLYANQAFETEESFYQNVETRTDL